MFQGYSRLTPKGVIPSTKTAGAAATADDWPTYRFSSMRSAVTTATTPEALNTKWTVDIGSHPTAPVVAGDSVYVADRDADTLMALDRMSGATRWSREGGLKSEGEQ